MPYNDLRKGRFSQSGAYYFVTTVTAQRQRLFEPFDLARCVVGEMRRVHTRGWLDSMAWVLMPDHLHWLFALGQEQTLADLMHGFKGRTARLINQRFGHAGPVWQPGYHDHALRREEDLRELARYIVANPLRAGLVERIGDYPHWDAAWLQVGFQPDSPAGMSG